MRTIRKVTLRCALAGALACGSAYASVPPDVPAAANAAADAEANTPALVVDTLDHGRFDLAEHRGSWVVVNFWATWCSPCLKEMPDLAAFDAARTDVEVIGLAYEEIAAEEMRAFLDKHPAGYPIALLDVYAPPGDFATPRGLPTTHLIAPDGRLADSFLGPVTSQELERAIVALQERAAPGDGSVAPEGG